MTASYDDYYSGMRDFRSWLLYLIWDPPSTNKSTVFQTKDFIELFTYVLQVSFYVCPPSLAFCPESLPGTLLTTPHMPVYPIKPCCYYPLRVRNAWCPSLTWYSYWWMSCSRPHRTNYISFLGKPLLSSSIQ